MSKYLKKILDAAEKHGEESMSDMEVGDLQEALRIAFEEMTEKQQKITAQRFSEEVCDTESED